MIKAEKTNMNLIIIETYSATNVLYIENVFFIKITGDL